MCGDAARAKQDKLIKPKENTVNRLCYQIVQVNLSNCSKYSNRWTMINKDRVETIIRIKQGY